MKGSSEFSAGFVLCDLEQINEFQLGNICEPNLATVSENRENNGDENSPPVHKLEASDGIT